VRQSRGLFDAITANSKLHEDGSTSVRPFVSLCNAALYREDETFEATGKSGRIRVMEWLRKSNQVSVNGKGKISMAFWHMIPSSMLGTYESFEGSRRLHFQCTKLFVSRQDVLLCFLNYKSPFHILCLCSEWLTSKFTEPAVFMICLHGVLLLFWLAFPVIFLSLTREMPEDYFEFCQDLFIQHFFQFILQVIQSFGVILSKPSHKFQTANI